MKTIDINTWNRRQHFEHFSKLQDPFFAITVPVDVTKAYQFSKNENISFFSKYLHDCMKAINDIDNFKYRIEDNFVKEYETIHASATIMRANKTFGFSFINYDDDLEVFLKHIQQEKERIDNTTELFPPVNGLDCIHCSAIPWASFTGHKEPVSGKQESIPKLAFAKAEKIGDNLKMNISINVNHALVDGYHVGLFLEKFQHYLNQ